MYASGGGGWKCRLVIESESERRSIVSDSLRPHAHTVYGQNLKWVAFPFSRGSSQPRDLTQVSHFAGRFFTRGATREAQKYWGGYPIPSPGDLPNPGIEPRVSCIAGDSYQNLLIDLSDKPPD